MVKSALARPAPVNTMLVITTTPIRQSAQANAAMTRNMQFKTIARVLIHLVVLNRRKVGF